MRNQLIITALFLLILSASSCGSGEKNKDTKAELVKLKTQQRDLQAKIAKLEQGNGLKDSVRKVPVIVTSMVPTQFRTYVELQGKVDADQSVVASAEAMGVVNAIYVRNGQHVNKG